MHATMNRGRRGSILGLGRDGGRLRGGFQASMLPGYSSGETSSGTSQYNGFGGSQTTAGQSSSSSNSTVIIQQLGE